MHVSAQNVHCYRYRSATLRITRAVPASVFGRASRRPMRQPSFARKGGGRGAASETTELDELRVPRERGAAARFVFGLRVPRPGYPRVY